MTMNLVTTNEISGICHSFAKYVVYCCSEFSVRKPSSGDAITPPNDANTYVNTVALAPSLDDTASDQSQPVYQQLNRGAAAAPRVAYENVRPKKLRRQRRAESSQ